MILPTIGSALALLLLQGASSTGEHPYQVDYLVPPAGSDIEVGGMDFLPDGRLVVSTRRGQVWIIENPLAEDPADASFRLFCEGLWEGLGLTVAEGEIYVVQRGELSRLRDVDGDGVCDHVDTIADDWGVSGNYHEFAYGLPRDAEGNFYITLNVSFFNPKWWHGKSTVPWRGWALRITPSGKVEPVASGLRSPCGIGQNAVGDLFVTDNQGDWMPASPVFHLKQGAFYGHPASLDWTEEYRTSHSLASDTVPPARAASDRTPPAVWLPYSWSRSPGNLVPDMTAGKFGPFKEQLFLAELTEGRILRLDLEKVRGEYQGAVLPFRDNVGSGVRLRFASDGTLFCGMTNRGWGGLSPASGIARLRWKGTPTFEIEHVHLLQDGFELTLTEPVGADQVVDTDAIELVQYDYDYWWEYGSPERATTELAVTSAELSDDRQHMTITVDGLEPARVARCKLGPLVSANGHALRNGEFAYTINQLPEGPLTTEQVARIVPPPPARDSDEAGWLRLTYGDATEAWDFSGWELCSAEIDADNPTRLVTTPGVSALTNTAASDPTDYRCKLLLGDAEIHTEFMLPEGGDGGIYLMGRYEVRFSDRSAEEGLSPAHSGGITGGADWDGLAPQGNLYRGAGQWHDLDIQFRAPRFDERGNKTENARIISVTLEGRVVQEDVELPGPSRGAPFQSEAPLGPLVFAGTRSPLALGNLRAKPRFENPDRSEGWAPLFEDNLDECITTGDAYWDLDEGILVGEGPPGHIFTPRDDYSDFELAGRFKISDGGNSGLYFRAMPTESWPDGFEAQINSSFADPQKTGSLYAIAPVSTHLVPPDTWFDYHITCRSTAAGTHIVIRINGVVIRDVLVNDKPWNHGHIAIQQHHEGSVIEVQDLRIHEF